MFGIFATSNGIFSLIIFVTLLQFISGPSNKTNEGTGTNFQSVTTSNQNSTAQTQASKINIPGFVVFGILMAVGLIGGVLLIYTAKKTQSTQ